MLAALPAGWLILLPSQFVDMAQSLLASLFFGSNFYWHFTLQAYGAESALLKPFLHTWSLAVEEQYYIVFPVLLVALYRWRESLVIPALASICMISLAFAQWMTQQDQSLSFYLLPSRLWELLAGALLAHISGSRSSIPSWQTRILPTLGLALVGLSLATIRYADGHPGFITVIPVVGTMLLIHFSGNGDWVTRLLASRLFVGIGLISYSLYLWHYPIFAFGRMLESAPTLGSKLTWIALSIALSIVSYFLLEQPFRNRRKVSLKLMVTCLAIPSLLVIGACIFIIRNDGVEGRLDRLDDIYGSNEYDNAKLKQQSWAILASIAGEQAHSGSLPGRPSPFEKRALWFTGQAANNVLVVGDSRSKDIFNAIYLNRELFEGTGVARFGMRNDLPEHHLTALFKAPNYAKAHTLIISFQADQQTLAQLPELIATAQSDDKRIIITSRSPSFRELNSKPLFDGYIQSRTEAQPYSTKGLDRLFYRHVMRRDKKIDERLIEISEKYNLGFLNRGRVVCDQEEKTCAATTPEQLKTYYDNLHWTVDGARYFGRKLHQDGWLQATKQENDSGASPTR